MTAVALFGIRVYQRAISPWLPNTCRFHPSCSEYSRIAFRKYGFWKGGGKTIGRLLRCHPFCDGGVDYP